jgi:hypothetical protein
VYLSTILRYGSRGGGPILTGTDLLTPDSRISGGGLETASLNHLFLRRKDNQPRGIVARQISLREISQRIISQTIHFWVERRNDDTPERTSERMQPGADRSSGRRKESTGFPTNL